MTGEKRFGEAEPLLQVHRDFWLNKPGLVLRSQLDYTREPFRRRICFENLRGELTPGMLDLEQLTSETVQAYQHRPLQNGDVFEFVQFAYVVPWLEAIAGCHLYYLGTGASIKAAPSNLEQRKLISHLEDTLDNLPSNAWFQKVAQGYQVLSKALGDRFPIAQTNMRGPGDIVGALLGQQRFVELMLEPSENKKFLKQLLELCTQIWIRTAKTQCDPKTGAEWGYCSPYGIWAPCLPARSQEDVAAILSPHLYAEYLLPPESRITAAFDYTVFHMHSSARLNIYGWKDFCQESKISCLEVALDPLGPRVTDLMETLVEINSKKPLILDSYSAKLGDEVEERISNFPGSVLHTRWDQTVR